MVTHSLVPTVVGADLIAAASMLFFFFTITLIRSGYISIIHRYHLKYDI